ncbi:MAG: hypothetical protein A2381_20180 [Bdellovibrionales bacterium RIFOXYB1_FULL_37_110]|nr:MAG: hypothetical protein A2181_03815 [Bdellovibrionales bacterium RIFOXYA1_FULL_38_20]OFZ51055.1 MAG: hypothetical protein A2417_19965 [Bdellovibrionales bacterium RIFOXYC1_FULL_37_79]OFZ60267.1 MAG: hypothetical protein A2381_20180 [Bdellovibrionales bacterium RIFOXYB1_FULL_37_110]OFZ63262.1 MAG: hypothetical protein A2577_01495 [Bdellovibrionales bacterium RIFOXYD1_FULL_36_51]
MDNFTEKRQDKRVKTSKKLRIYSSVSRVPYTVDISDISQRGASLKTKFLPTLDEVITFEAIDDYVQRLHFGNARVRWVKNSQNLGDSGFGIEFDDDFPLEVIN